MKQNFTTRQILEWKKNALKFELKFFSRFQNLKKCLYSKNHVLVHFTPWKRQILNFSWLSKNITLNWKFYYVSDSQLKNRNASDFELKTLRCVWFSIESFTTSQILKKNSFLKSMILKNNIFFRSTISKKKKCFIKQILKRNLHTKNQVLIQLTL